MHVKLYVIYFKISHTQILHQVATSWLNFDKSKIIRLHKMRDTRAGDSRTEFSNKSQKWIKMILKW